MNDEASVKAWHGIRLSLKQARKDQGLTQKELGVLMGVSSDSVRFLENKTNAFPNVTRVLRWAAALDMQLRPVDKEEE